MAKKKIQPLNDEQLSRVLSEQAIGKLYHNSFYCPYDSCGCIAGAALVITDGLEVTMPDVDVEAHRSLDRAYEISDAVQGNKKAYQVKYPGRPETMLRFLASKGL